jgi:hypothetical protein
MSLGITLSVNLDLLLGLIDASEPMDLRSTG